MDFSFLSSPKYPILQAFWGNIQLTFWSAIGALVLGTVLAGMRVSPVPLMRWFSAIYVGIVRNTPLTLIIIMMSQVLYTQLGLKLASRGGGAQGAIDFLYNQNFRLAVVGFILYTSTFVAEAIRSGINTVPPGQAEAARAIGMKFSQVLNIVVLPQAFRAVIAPLASVLIALIKNTTVAAAIFSAEVTGLMATMMENEADKFVAIFIIIAAGFIVLTLPVGILLGRVAQKATVRR